MVVYVKISAEKLSEIKNKLDDLNNQLNVVIFKSIEFKHLSEDYTKKSFGTKTKNNEIIKNIRLIKTFLPDIETVKVKERTFHKITPKNKGSCKRESVRQKYRAELEEIQKMISELNR